MRILSLLGYFFDYSVRDHIYQQLKHEKSVSLISVWRKAVHLCSSRMSCLLALHFYGAFRDGLLPLSYAVSIKHNGNSDNEKIFAASEDI